MDFTQSLLQQAKNGTDGLNLESLKILSDVLGWAYFVAWSVSFYPQVYENFKRKSVEGLSFDFIALNIIGWIAYSIFNCTLYWSPAMNQAYLDRFGPPNPIKPNDIFFGLHAFCITALTIGQCFYYKKSSLEQKQEKDEKLFNRSTPGVDESYITNYRRTWPSRLQKFLFSKGQSVSVVVIGIICSIYAASLIQLPLCIFGIELWLDYLYYFSYVKVGITLLKYIPQVFLNWKRKSTLGWSIGNILLDTTGGVLSFLQIFLDGLNSGNWQVFEGGGAKFALSIISLLFDFIFVVQHYCLYAKGRYEIIK